ncbi:50S ribosomal protein L6 [Candidatus Woesearchaeota archaeon]|nr:50S ribosomal protein L6 [Candidatus Woesearchaeota archaeon]
MTDLMEEIQFSENINVELIDDTLKIGGPKGKVERRLAFPNVELKKQDNKIQLMSKGASKREKRMINTFKSHIKNMILGTSEGFEYKLKICSSHFPMSVSVDKNIVIIKNFLGEKTPRSARILEGINVKVEGFDVIVTGIDLEKVGQTAANIESACRITNRDRRVFQDGIYIYKTS